jgi:hypothetical protein
MIEIDDPENIDEFENLLLNLHGGLKPQHLSKEDVKLLEENVGEDWFEEMGYDEYDGYEKPFS